MPSHGDAEALDRYSALVPTLLLMVCVVVSYVIQRYNVRAVQPSGAALIVGVAFGAVARAKTARGADVAAFQFSPQAFFILELCLRAMLLTQYFRVPQARFFRMFDTLLTNYVADAGISTCRRRLFFFFHLFDMCFKFVVFREPYLDNF